MTPRVAAESDFSGGGPLRMILLGIALAGIGCAQTRETRSVEEGGFLRDYSELRKGEGDEAQLVYVDPSTDFTRYDKIVIESVTLWATEDSDFAKLSDEQRQALTDYFYQALRKQLEEDYEIVAQNGPGVMRLRAALTEAEGANVTLNVITTTIPQLKLLSSLGGLATDTAVIVGKAGFEAELVDSKTNKRLAAAVGRRVGTKTFRGMFSRWSDVEIAFDTWAENL